MTATSWYEASLVDQAAIQCEWCSNEALYSINWECGHACAMCEQCFGPEDNERGWSIDIMDWDETPSRCPACAG